METWRERFQRKSVPKRGLSQGGHSLETALYRCPLYYYITYYHNNILTNAVHMLVLVINGVPHFTDSTYYIYIYIYICPLLFIHYIAKVINGVPGFTVSDSKNVHHCKSTSFVVSTCVHLVQPDEVASLHWCQCNWCSLVSEPANCNEIKQQYPLFLIKLCL